MLSSLRLILAVNISRLITFLVKTLQLGAASVLPGAIALRLYPQILSVLCQQISQGIILVCGTNGKTTTSLLIKNILTLQGYRVVHNETGANLVNGLVTALINQANWLGKLRAEYGILEVDENVLPLVVDSIQPKFILALNISQRWQDAIATLNPETVVILNGDDPTLVYLGENLRQQVSFFGLNQPELAVDSLDYATDSTYCPRCGHSLNYQHVYLSHLGDFYCPSCGFTKPKLAINSQEWSQILIGIYNKYNTIAAALLSLKVGINPTIIKQGIKEFKAAFGRAEEIIIDNKTVKILLAKNPVGLNETIRAVQQANQGQNTVTLVVLNDRTPDGTDVSWIWDVDTEPLTGLQGKIIVSGDRTYDLALRMQYSNPSPEHLIVIDNLSTAIKTALATTPPGVTLYILPTYSAMLEVRQLLTGKKIL
jgi:UDP-N-acetylmuramyl tripeptide synthase